MKIATYNVNGINGRLPVLLRWLQESSPDVVCLQELKAESPSFHDEVKSRLRDKETLAWAIPFLFTPFSAVYYPVAVLPASLRPVAWALPTTHAFEGMRTVLSGGGTAWDRVGWGLGENAALLAAAAVVFAWLMHVARDRGLLLRVEG